MAKKKAKPLTEIQLGELQEKYLADPTDRRVADEYFLLLQAYARSLTLKEIKRKKHYLPPERVEEVATEATVLLLSQYGKPNKKTGEPWSIWGSFAGALRWKVVEALYSDANEDRTTSLNAPVGEDGAQEMADILAKIGGETLWVENNNDPQESFLRSFDTTISEVFSVIDDAAEVLPYRLTLLFHVYLLLYIRRPKTRLTMPSFKKFFLTKTDEEAFDLLLLEVRNRIAAHVL